MRLSKDDIALLRQLDKHDDSEDQQAEADGAVPAEAPKALFEFNLVKRQGSGQLQLTKTGERALFQAECIEALDQALAGAMPAISGGVERWLVSNGFLHAQDKRVTSRGKLWLASLSPLDDGTEGSPPPPTASARLASECATAASFAARRAAD